MSDQTSETQSLIESRWTMVGLDRQPIGEIVVGKSGVVLGVIKGGAQNPNNESPNVDPDHSQEAKQNIKAYLNTLTPHERNTFKMLINTVSESVAGD